MTAVLAGTSRRHTNQARQPKAAPTRLKAPLKKRRAMSSQSDESDAEDDDRSAMLAALEAHSRALLGFGPSMEAETSSAAAKRAGSAATSTSEEESGDEESGEDDGWVAGDGMVSDSEDEFGGDAIASLPVLSRTAGTNSSRVPEVVFDQSIVGERSQLSKSDRRAFMNGSSSKMMGIANSDSAPPRSTRSDLEDPEEQTNTALDKTLHNMLLSTLLPSHQASEASRPVHKRDAMSSRLLQLAGYTLPGESGRGSGSGSGSASPAVFIPGTPPSEESKRLSSQPAKIRAGILKAQSKRAEAARSEMEKAGSWVRGRGGLGDLGKGAKRKERDDRMEMGTLKRKKGMAGTKGESGRDRGLAGGVGRYEGGMLKISQRDISAVERRSGGAGEGGRRIRSCGKKGGRGGRGGGRR